MNDHRNALERKRQAAAIGVWENEGGATGPGSMDHQYGRRIETDRTWTVYHVFTGVPAHGSGRAMIGLSRSDATDRMMSLNLRNFRRRTERAGSSALGVDPCGTTAGPPLQGNESGTTRGRV